MKKTTYRTVDLEDGRPSLAEALVRLEHEIKYSRSLNIGILKLIHGYGSSGKGGRLKNGVRARLLDECGELRHSRDLDRGNVGVTFVKIK